MTGIDWVTALYFVGGVVGTLVYQKWKSGGTLLPPTDNKQLEEIRSDIRDVLTKLLAVVLAKNSPTPDAPKTFESVIDVEPLSSQPAVVDVNKLLEAQMSGFQNIMAQTVEGFKHALTQQKPN